MLNQVIVVGRLQKDIKYNDENKTGTFKLLVPRSYKNTDGEFDTDVLSCLILENIVSSCRPHLRKGDLLGVKGRLQSENNKMVILAEKLTFLSNQKEGK